MTQVYIHHGLFERQEIHGPYLFPQELKGQVEITDGRLFPGVKRVLKTTFNRIPDLNIIIKFLLVLIHVRKIQVINIPGLITLLNVPIFDLQTNLILDFKLVFFIFPNI